MAVYNNGLYKSEITQLVVDTASLFNAANALNAKANDLENDIVEVGTIIRSPVTSYSNVNYNQAEKVYTFPAITIAGTYLLTMNAVLVQQAAGTMTSMYLIPAINNVQQSNLKVGQVLGDEDVVYYTISAGGSATMSLNLGDLVSIYCLQTNAALSDTPDLSQGRFTLVRLGNPDL